jgi:hypothetical protein
MDLTEITKPTLARPREANETDYVSKVEAIMRDKNYPLVDSWLKDAEIVEAKDKNADMQRFLINRNLRVKLGMSNHNTSVERFALDANTSEKEYLANIKKYIVPALVVISSELN